MKQFTIVGIIIVIILLILVNSQKSQSSVKKQPENIPLKIIAAGDIACGFESKNNYECKQQQTANLIKKENPDLVLALGDLQYDYGELKNFQQFYDSSWGKFKNITKPVAGNHEYGIAKAQGYFDYFTSDVGEKYKGYYSFDKADWHFVALNSNCGDIAGCDKNSAQYKWLQKDLEQNSKLCAIAFWHHPRFSSGLHGNNDFMQDIWQLLYDKQVDLVLSGHDHSYERFAPQDGNGNLDSKNGVREIVVGTGGKSLYPINNITKNSESRNDSSFGVLKLSLDKDKYSWDFITINNNFSDIGETNCH